MPKLRLGRQGMNHNDFIHGLINIIVAVERKGKEKECRSMNFDY